MTSIGDASPKVRHPEEARSAVSKDAQWILAVESQGAASRKKDSSSSVTRSGCSCCTQWPAPRPVGAAHIGAGILLHALEGAGV